MANIQGFNYDVQKDMDQFVYNWASKLTLS